MAPHAELATPKRPDVARRILVTAIALAAAGAVGIVVWKAVPSMRASVGAPTDGQVVVDVKKETPNAADQMAERDRARYRDVNLIKLALTSYINDKLTYPAALTELTPTYMQTLPTDPSTGKAFPYAKTEGGYVMSFTLESGLFSFSAGQHTITPLGIDAVPVTPPTASEDATPGSGAPQGKDDSDGDGLTDAEETQIYRTNPNAPDTDSDGFTDGQEVQGGYNPLGPGKLPPPPDTGAQQ